MPYATLRYEVSEAGVATIALDQPDTRNALSDALLDGLIAAFEAARDDVREQHASILLGQPCEAELGQAVEVVLGHRVAHGDHDRHRVGPDSSCDEAEDLARGGIQPLRVLDEAEQWPLVRHGGQQAEHGQPDEEPLRHLTRHQA